MRIATSVRSVVLVCATLFAGGALVTAHQAEQGRQQPPSPPAPVQAPVFRTSTELVSVDVVVVDKDGKPVSGLTKGDFEILDRKQPQAIGTFEELAFDRTPVDLEARPARFDVASNRFSASDRRIILVVDEPRVMISRTDRAKEVARRIIQSLGGRVQMALVRTNGKPGAEFTRDPAVLLDTLDDIRGEKTHSTYGTFSWGMDASMADSSFRAGLFSGLGPTSSMGHPGAAFRGMSNPGDSGLFPTLADAAMSLSRDHGRRTAMVVVSEGQPLWAANPAQLVQMPNSGMLAPREDLQWMVSSARRANVAVYAIDPRGKANAGSEGYTSSDYWMRREDTVTLSRDSLNDMAGLTGGFAFTGSDDFEAGANKVLNELDHYYLLGFSPVDTKSTAPREISVRVDRPGLTARFRRYYSTAKPKAVETFTKPIHWLQTLIAEVTPSGGLPVELFATVLPPIDGKGAARVAIAAYADVAANETVDFGVWAIDINNQKISKQSGLPLTFSSGATVPYLMLKTGRYQLRVAARIQPRGRGGSAYLTIDVPNFSKSPLAISGIVLASAGGTRPTVAADLPFAPTLTRAFTTPADLRVGFGIWRTTGAVPAAASIDILDVRGAVLSHVEHSVPMGGDGRIDATVPLGGLAPGIYRLRVAATSGLLTTRREVGFAIVDR